MTNQAKDYLLKHCAYCDRKMLYTQIKKNFLPADVASLASAVADFMYTYKDEANYLVRDVLTHCYIGGFDRIFDLGAWFVTEYSDWQNLTPAVREMLNCLDFVEYGNEMKNKYCQTIDNEHHFFFKVEHTPLGKEAD